jgi:hypothetical protein
VAAGGRHFGCARLPPPREEGLGGLGAAARGLSRAREGRSVLSERGQVILWREEFPEEGRGRSLEDAHETLWTLLAEQDAEMEDDAKWTFKEQTALTQFLIKAFQSLDVPQVASSVLQLTSLPLWTALSPKQRALEFQTYPKLERHLNCVMTGDSPMRAGKKTAKKSKRRKVEVMPESPRHEQTALVRRPDAFYQALKAPFDDDAPKHELMQRVRFVALFLALLIDLLSQLPTRRFLLTVLRRRHLRSTLKKSALIQHALQWQSVGDRKALDKQLALLDACMSFPIEAHTGTSFSPREYCEHQARHIQAL